MSNLKELKIAVALAREAYNEHLKTLEPYKRAYIKALEAHDKALDDALEDVYTNQEKKAKKEINK
jgi:hypothetical protein